MDGDGGKRGMVILVVTVVVIVVVVVNGGALRLLLGITLDRRWSAMASTEWPTVLAVFAEMSIHTERSSSVDWDSSSDYHPAGSATRPDVGRAVAS